MSEEDSKVELEELGRELIAAKKAADTAKANLSAKRNELQEIMDSQLRPLNEAHDTTKAKFDLLNKKLISQYPNMGTITVDGSTVSVRKTLSVNVVDSVKLHHHTRNFPVMPFTPSWDKKLLRKLIDAGQIPDNLARLEERKSVAIKL
jgi:hypothetical protein